MLLSHYNAHTQTHTHANTYLGCVGLGPDWSRRFWVGDFNSLIQMQTVFLGGVGGGGCGRWVGSVF